MSKARDVSRLFSKTGSSSSDVGSSTVSSDTPPAGAGAGDKWFNTTNLTTYIYYDDGTSLQWVPGAAPIPGPAGATGPAGSPNFSAINQAIIPDTDVTHDLGSSTHKWKDLYLSGSTLYLGASATISAGTGSEIVLPSIKIGAGSNAVKLSANASGGLETQAVVGGTTQAVKPAGGTVQVADLAAMQALANPSIGDFVSVVSNKTIYMYNGTGFYKIAVMVNESPTAITGVDGSYQLATDGTATTITAISSDPEGRPLTWSYAVSSGALNGTTVAQAVNVFTITPHASNVAAFSLTFSVTDGINGAVNAVSTFGLSFVITNSRYTALSVKATAAGSNQTFDDASTSNHTITTRGNTTTSSFSPYRHGGYSLGLDGTNDYITIPQTTDLDLTGDFTVECWVYFNDTAGGSGLMGKWGGSGLYGWSFYATAANFWFYTGNNGVPQTQGNFSYGPPVINQWYHLAVSRTGSTISTYVNGTRTNTFTDSYNCTANTTLTVGSDGTALSTYSIDGFMRDVRIVNGTGLYTGTSFAVPTEPLTAVTNTKFLLGDLPYFKDQSASNHTINVYKTSNASGNNASLEPKSLFDNSAYSGASNGVSAYFDGIGPDGLDLPASSDFLLDGEFTIDFWFNADDLSGDWYERTLFKIGNGSGSGTSTWIFVTIYGGSLTGKICFTHSTAQTDHTNGVRTPDKAISAGTWNHVAITRDYGNTLKMWLNGALTETKTNRTASYGSSSIGPSFGYDKLTEGRYKGYISDFRIIKGTCLYTVNFTPPTAPLTAVANTKLLLNPETSISDLSQQHPLTCIADAATSTTQVKFAGTKSIAFDGTGDAIISNRTYSSAHDFLGPFTVECWVRPSSTGNQFFWCQGTYTIEMGINGNNLRMYRAVGNTYTNFFTVGEFSINNWHHVALVRDSSNVIKCYLNGTASSTTVTDATTYSSLAGTNNSRFIIGGENLNFTSVSWPWNGYIQDLRVTQGLARYTANFTPPTAELQG